MLIDIIYSKGTGKVYCIKDSYYYKNKLQKEVKKQIDTMQVPPHYLNILIAKNPNVSEWNITDILEIEEKS